MKVLRLGPESEREADDYFLIFRQVFVGSLAIEEVDYFVVSKNLGVRVLH